MPLPDAGGPQRTADIAQPSSLARSEDKAVHQRSAAPPAGEPAREAPGLAPRPAAGLALPPAVLRSEELLRGLREVTILHAGFAYRLRLTANDKLILTK